MKDFAFNMGRIHCLVTTCTMSYQASLVPRPRGRRGGDVFSPPMRPGNEATYQAHLSTGMYIVTGLHDIMPMILYLYGLLSFATGTNLL